MHAAKTTVYIAPESTNNLSSKNLLDQSLFSVKEVAGCCSNKNPFERSLKRVVLINLGEAEDKRFQLFEPYGRVLKSPGARLRFIKKSFQTSEKGFEQRPVDYLKPLICPVRDVHFSSI